MQMEQEGSVWRLGDLKSLKDEYESPQKFIQSIVIAGQKEDCFLLEHIIRQLNPTKKVITVCSSTELLDLLDFYIPDLLMIDLQMPCKKGVECLKEIRETRIYNDLPIIAYSRSNRSSNATISHQFGADHYFSFPKDETQLWHILIKIISKEWTRGQETSSKKA